MDDILVSVSCMAYNHEEYIAEALESFLMQKTNFKFEIIIHDDASTDKTTEIIKDYHLRYPEIIKPIFQSENQYTKGVRRIDATFINPKALGKYIAVCEGDDYWTDPLKLQKQVDYMEANFNCSMCFHAAEKVKSDGKRIGMIRPYYGNRIASTEDFIIEGGGFIATNTIFYRTKLMDINSRPDFYMKAPVGDYPLQIYLSTQKYAYYIDESMSAYRKGVEGSWSLRKNDGENQTKRKILHNESTIQMLHSFNKYSNNKYLDVVNHRITMLEFEILILKNEVKQLESPKYRDIYNSLGVKEKIKIHARKNFPYIYHKLINLKKYRRKYLS